MIIWNPSNLCKVICPIIAIFVSPTVLKNTYKIYILYYIPCVFAEQGYVTFIVLLRIIVFAVIENIYYYFYNIRYM